MALLSTYNEERFIAGCLEHLARQGVDVYLIDNASTDRTVEIAERYRRRGLVGVETLPRAGMFSLRPQLDRKEHLAATLDADWFIHVDADQVNLPPRAGQTLAAAVEDVDRQGYTAINFFQFTFVPTRESPHHDHADYQRTMRWYYPCQPSFPHALRAWKRQRDPVELAWSGGHRVRFPGLRMYPESFRYRHYLFLSVEHAIRKYVEKRFDPAEVSAGWHGWRARLAPHTITLPSQAELRTYVSDDMLDPRDPRTGHYLGEAHLAAVVESSPSRPETGSQSVGRPE